MFVVTKTMTAYALLIFGYYLFSSCRLINPIISDKELLNSSDAETGFDFLVFFVGLFMIYTGYHLVNSWTITFWVIWLAAFFKWSIGYCYNYKLH